MPRFNVTTRTGRTYRVEQLSPTLCDTFARTERLAAIAQEVVGIASTHDVDLANLIGVEVSLINADGSRATRPLEVEVIALAGQIIERRAS